MLKKRKQPDGKTVLVRSPYRPEDYTPTEEQLAPITSMGFFSVRELMTMPDGPFGSFWLEKVVADDKTWWRACHMTEEWCVLLEDTNSKLSWADLRVVPPEEARDISKGYDAQRGRPVIEADPATASRP